MISALRLFFAWVGFLLLWFVFAFQISRSELFFGAAASAVAVLSGYVTLQAVPACFSPRLRWIVQAWRLPGMIASDLWLLCKHLLRTLARKPSRSFFATTPFQSAEVDCRACGQRALAVLLVTTTPNSVVLDIDAERGEMFFHQAEPAPLPKLVSRLQE